MEEIIKIPVNLRGGKHGHLEFARDSGNKNNIIIRLEGREICYTEWLESLHVPLKRAIDIWKEDE